MNKKVLNTLLLAGQWILSLLLSIYLLVPVYNFSPSSFGGSEIYSPYENWKQFPLQTLQLSDEYIKGTDPEKILRINPFLDSENLYSLDKSENTFYSPFLLGHSQNDLQYLVKKKGSEKNLVFKLDNTSPSFNFELRGIRLLLLDNDSLSSVINTILDQGNPTAIIATSNSSHYAYNLVMSANANPISNLEALKKGNNLLVFSKEEIFNEEIDQIPVIRTIEWKDNTLKIDLSEKGEINIISSGFSMDTLVSNISLKLNNPNWFRFEVRFPKDHITYLSNPFFRYSAAPFDVIYPKTNNQLTIFINLSWLIGIILLNLGINRIRKKYL